MTQIIVRPLKAFHRNQVMVFLVPRYIRKCLCGVKCTTASLLKSCRKEGNLPMGTRPVCNTFFIPFFELPEKREREREKEDVLTIQNSSLLSLIISILGSANTSTFSNKAANIQELLPSFNWLSSAA